MVGERRGENIGPGTEYGDGGRLRHIEFGDDSFGRPERRVVRRTETFEALEIHAEADRQILARKKRLNHWTSMCDGRGRGTGDSGTNIRSVDLGNARALPSSNSNPCRA